MLSQDVKRIMDKFDTIKCELEQASARMQTLSAELECFDLPYTGYYPEFSEKFNEEQTDAHKTVVEAEWKLTEIMMLLDDQAVWFDYGWIDDARKRQEA